MRRTQLTRDNTLVRSEIEASSDDVDVASAWTSVAEVHMRRLLQDHRIPNRKEKGVEKFGDCGTSKEAESHKPGLRAWEGGVCC
ncbi:hypothetical protein GN956_G9864 [Arapaima gigas]